MIKNIDIPFIHVRIIQSTIKYKLKLNIPTALKELLIFKEVALQRGVGW